MKTITKNIGLYSVGTVFFIEVTDIKNDGDTSIANVEVAVDVPEGVTWNSGNFPQGAYDTGTDKWLVGTLLSGANLTATFGYEVTDDTKGPFSFTFTITSPTSCTGCNTERQFCVVIEGVACSAASICSGWPTTEQIAYYEGTDTVYVKAYKITQDDVTAGANYDFTDLPVVSTDVIRIEGNTKYLAGGDTQIALINSAGNFESGATSWTIPTGSAWDDEDPTWTMRIKVYYIKRAESRT